MTTTTQPDGTLEQVGDRWRLRFVRRLPHPQEKVWRAITEFDHLASWFPSNVHGERAEGAALRFVFRENEAEDMDGEIVVYDPLHVFEFTWGEDLLRFELAPDGDGTVLTFTDTIDEQGRGARDGGGWHVCLAALISHLDGTDEGQPPWRPVYEHYQEVFGPEASTIGPPEGHPEG